MSQANRCVRSLRGKLAGVVQSLLLLNGEGCPLLLERFLGMAGMAQGRAENEVGFDVARIERDGGAEQGHGRLRVIEFKLGFALAEQRLPVAWVGCGGGTEVNQSLGGFVLLHQNLTEQAV